MKLFTRLFYLYAAVTNALLPKTGNTTPTGSEEHGLVHQTPPGNLAPNRADITTLLPLPGTAVPFYSRSPVELSLITPLSLLQTQVQTQGLTPEEVKRAEKLIDKARTDRFNGKIGRVIEPLKKVLKMGYEDLLAAEMLFEAAKKVPTLSLRLNGEPMSKADKETYATGLAKLVADFSFEYDSYIPHAVEANLYLAEAAQANNENEEEFNRLAKAFELDKRLGQPQVSTDHLHRLAELSYLKFRGMVERDTQESSSDEEPSASALDPKPSASALESSDSARLILPATGPITLEQYKLCEELLAYVAADKANLKEQLKHPVTRKEGESKSGYKERQKAEKAETIRELTAKLAVARSEKDEIASTLKALHKRLSKSDKQTVKDEDERKGLEKYGLLDPISPSM